MTSRERVLTACNHRQPDRVPIDLSGHPSSGIAAIAYAKLRDYLGLPKKTIRVYDPIQQLAIVDDDVLEKFGVDVHRSRAAVSPSTKHPGQTGHCRMAPPARCRRGHCLKRQTEGGSSAPRAGV